MASNTDISNLADDERNETDFQRQEEAAGREQLDVSATQQAEKEQAMAKDLDDLRALVGRQFYGLLKEGKGREKLVKAAQNVLHEEQDKLSAAEKQEAEKARIREAIGKEKPEAAGILETFQKMSPGQRKAILQRGRWTRTLKDGTQQTLIVQEEQKGNMFFVDATGKRTEITADMKFRFTERFQKGTVPEGIAAGKEFPFNHKGKWYLAKTDGKLTKEGTLVLLLKDADGKEWRATCPPEHLSVYREISVNANGVLNKSGKPDRYALKYTPQQKKEPPVAAGRTPASPAAVPPSRPATQPDNKPEAAPDASAQAAEAPAEAPAPQPKAAQNGEEAAETKRAAPAAPPENQTLRQGMEKVLAIKDKDKQREALAELIGQEVEKRMEQRKTDLPLAPAAAPAAPGEIAAPENPKGWFGKTLGWLKNKATVVGKFFRKNPEAAIATGVGLGAVAFTPALLAAGLAAGAYGVFRYIRKINREGGGIMTEEKEEPVATPTRPVKKPAGAPAKPAQKKPATAPPGAKATTPATASTPKNTPARPSAVKPAAIPAKPVAPETKGETSEQRQTRWRKEFPTIADKLIAVAYPKDGTIKDTDIASIGREFKKSLEGDERADSLLRQKLATELQKPDIAETQWKQHLVAHLRRIVSEYEKVKRQESERQKTKERNDKITKALSDFKTKVLDTALGAGAVNPGHKETMEKILKDLDQATQAEVAGNMLAILNGAKTKEGNPLTDGFNIKNWLKSKYIDKKK